MNGGKMRFEWIRGVEASGRILNFLQKADSSIIPTLSDRVNISLYAEKIAKNAETLFVVSGNQDVASCSVYCNTKRAFITSIVVLPFFQRQHIGQKMLNAVKSYVKKRGCNSIYLEVANENFSALSFYTKNGFVLKKRSSFWSTMKYQLKNDELREDSMETVIKRTVLNITTYCNLKCKHCLAFIPYYKERFSMGTEEAEKILKAYFQVVDQVEHFTITGGEPLLNRNVCEILELCSRYFAQITNSLDFVTNGTIMIPDAVLDFFEQYKEKTKIVLSDYGEKLSTEIVNIEKKLKERNINYRISKFYGDDLYYDGWIDFTDHSLKWKTMEERDCNAQKCLHRVGKYFIINEGELHCCSRSFWRMKNGIIPKIMGEYVPLLDDSVSIEQKRQYLMEMLNMKSSTSCAYCVGLVNGVPRVEPAQQINESI